MIISDLDSSNKPVIEPALLGHNTGLEKLTLDFGSFVTPRDMIQVFTTDSEGSLLRALASLNTPGLQTLILQLHVRVPAGSTLRLQADRGLQDGSDAESWQKINDVIKGGGFNALREVFVKVAYYTRRSFDLNGPEGYDLRRVHAATEKAMQHLLWYSFGLLRLTYDVSHA